MLENEARFARKNETFRLIYFTVLSRQAHERVNSTKEDFEKKQPNRISKCIFPARSLRSRKSISSRLPSFFARSKIRSYQSLIPLFET